MKISRDIQNSLFGFSVVSFLALIFFWQAFHISGKTPIEKASFQIAQLIDSGRFFFSPFPAILVGFLSGFSKDINQTRMVCIVVFACLVGLRWVVVYEKLRSSELLSTTEANSPALFASLLLLTHNLPSVFLKRVVFTVGAASPNDWIIMESLFVTPLLFVFYDHLFKLLETPNKMSFRLVVATCYFMGWIQPGITLSIAFAYWVTCGTKQILRTENVRLNLALIFGLVLSVVFYIGQCLSAGMSFSQFTFPLAFAPFVVWGKMSNSFIYSMIAMNLFPYAILFYNFSEFRINRKYRFAWILFLVQLVLFVLFVDRFPAGARLNLGVPLISALFLIFYESFVLLIKNENPKVQPVCATLFGIHILCGIIFLVRLIVFKQPF